MKTCPHCHIQVGGSAQYCPLCQNPLVGTPEPDRYPKVVPPARQASLFYRIAAFVLLGAAVICGSSYSAGCFLYKCRRSLYQFWIC